MNEATDGGWEDGGGGDPRGWSTETWLDGDKEMQLQI